MDIKALMNSFRKSSTNGNTNYGRAFDDAEICAGKGLPFPCGIIIRKGVIIDNVGFAYDGFTLAHGGKGGSEQSISLRHDEYIIKVTGTYEPFGRDVVISSLEFTTNQGNVFSANRPTRNSQSFEYKAEDGYAICALHGHADNYLGAIGFYARKINADSGNNLKDMGNMFNSMKK